MEFQKRPDIEHLAAVIHHSFLDEAEKTRLRAEKDPSERHRTWTIDPSIQRAYEQLQPDNMKDANRAAARRIFDHLALIDFVVVAKSEREDESWKPQLVDALNDNMELLAQAEHLGWCLERLETGWTYAGKRDNDRKHHPLLVPWAQLTPSGQDKDRSSVRSIPSVLDAVGFKAVPGAPAR